MTNQSRHQLTILATLLAFVSSQYWETLYSLPATDPELQLSTDNLLGTIFNLGKQWKIEFDFKATSFKWYKWTNIIWLKSNIGYTAIYIYSKQNTPMKIRFSYKVNMRQYYRDFDNDEYLPLIDQWMNFQISQVKDLDGMFKLKLSIGLEDNLAPESI